MPILSFAVLSGGSLIDLDGTVFIQLLIFALSFVVLRSFVFRPMMRLFDARENATEGTRVAARDTTEEAQEKARVFEATLEAVRVQAAAERERLRKEGLQLERTLLEGVRRDVQKKAEEGDLRLDSEAKRLRRDMEIQVPALARQAASRLLGREVTAK